jgi:hypothetical protein
MSDKGLKFVDILAGNPLKASDFHVQATEEECWNCMYGRAAKEVMIASTIEGSR